jgi:hypothetical protein
MATRWRAAAIVFAIGSLTFGGCLYPDPDKYAGPCRFKGRDDTLCGKCLVEQCPAAVDDLCDGTSDGDFQLEELDRCVGVNRCSSSGWNEPFKGCLEKCTVCGSAN